MPRGSRVGSLDASAIASICNSLGADPHLFTGSTDTIPSEGMVILNGAGIDACVIAAPIAGDFRNGGQDGYILRVFDASGHAHTVTGPSNCFSPSHHIATFNGTVGSNMELQAWNGTWYPVGTSLGVTFS